MAQVHTAQRGLAFVQFAVEPNGLDMCLVLDAEVAQLVDGLFAAGISADYGTAFERIENLGGVSHALPKQCIGMMPVISSSITSLSLAGSLDAVTGRCRSVTQCRGGNRAWLHILKRLPICERIPSARGALQVNSPVTTWER